MSPVEIDVNGDIRLVAGRRFAVGPEAKLAVEGTDPRLTAGGIPHASTHVDGGSDEITSKLDERAFADRVDLLANRPAAGIVGRRFFASDTNQGFLDIGAAWVETQPPAHSGTHKHGGSDEVATATPAANAIPKADGTGKLASGWIPSGGGPPAAHATTHADGGTDEIITALDTRAYPTPIGTHAARPAAGQAGRRYFENDTGHEFIDQGGFWGESIPGVHASQHQHGGADEVATATPGANAIPKAGSGALLAPKWVFCEVISQAADATNNSTISPSNTDLIFTYAANSIYLIDLYLFYQSAATTTGLALAWDLSSTVTAMELAFAHVLATTGTLTGGDSVADDTVRGISSGVNTASVDVPILASGLIKTGANTGTARLRFRTEVNASQVTFKAGSTMRVMKV